MLQDPVTVSKTPAIHVRETIPMDFDNAVQMVRGGYALDQATRSLLKVMTRAERLGMLDGDVPFWRGLRGILFDRYNREPFVMGAIPRLRVPGIRFTDGPRGIVMHSSTCFPVSMSRGATWDVDLEQRIGNAIGLEGRAHGANFFAGICINLPRHPAWGRSQETYGEDPVLLGEFGVALHRGVRKHLMTCVKHYALNSMENARFKVDVQAEDGALHDIYLPHFRRVVEDGVTSVMTSYNSVRGEFAGQNQELLDEVLRKEWAFKGFVLSDFIFGFRDSVKSLKAGLDVEAPFTQQRALHLPKALGQGELNWSDVDRSCQRILSAQLEHAARTGYAHPDPSVVFCDEHRALARQAASQGMVLLKNERVSNRPLLPLDRSKIKTMAIIGRLANQANTGDRGSSAVFAPKVVTFYEGLRAALPNAKVLLQDSDNVEEAKRLAATADVVLCVVGYDATDEGEYVVPDFSSQQELLDLLPPTLDPGEAEVREAIEGRQKTGFGSGAADTEALVPGAGGDRKSLRLRNRDVDIINAVSTVCSKTIVSVVAAGAVIMEEWIPNVPAVLMTWYCGAEGGHALADVLLGKVDPGGRMPFSVPRSEEHLPYLDIEASKITYDGWFGQRLLDKLGVAARFPMGFGLSYTTFVMNRLSIDGNSLDWSRERFSASVKVTNTGAREGRHVLQVYGKSHASSFSAMVLLGFISVVLSAKDSIMVSVPCSLRPLKQRREGRFVFVGSTVDIQMGAHAGDGACLQTSLSLPMEQR